MQERGVVGSETRTLRSSANIPQPRLPWLFLVPVAAALLGLFFSYPLAREIFGPLVALMVFLGAVRPVWALGLLVVTVLPALSIPLVLRLPYFSGAEPLAWAFLLGIGLRRLVRAEKADQGRFRDPASKFVLLFVLVVAASCVLPVLTLAELFDGWGSRLLWDAAGKIFFWRWGNPLHVLRMGLLLLTGPVVFWVAGSVLREARGRGPLVVLVALVGVAAGLAGVSALDLFWRGKSLSLWPGFGPIFTDKNAYAGFWVFVSPLLWVPAIRLRGWARAAAWVGLGVTGFWCAVSFSITGWLAWPVTGILVLMLLWRRGDWTPSRRLLAAGLTCLVAGGLAAAAGAWMFGPRIRLAERLGERISFWLPAWEAFQDRPLLGHGPGEFYRLLPEYRERLPGLPKSHFAQENVHNYFLQLAAETGALGLAAFLGWMGAILLPAVRVSEWPSPGPSKGGSPPDISLLREGSTRWRKASLRFWVAAQQAGQAAWGDGRIAAAAAVLGLLIFSLAQHPLLRPEFQIWLGVLAAVSARPRPALPDTTAERRGPLGLPGASRLAGAVALAALVQAQGWGLADRSSFHYGWHEPPAGGSRRAGPGEYVTEGIAFLRLPAEEAPSRLTLRCLPGEERADVSLYLGEAWYLVTVTPEPVAWEVRRTPGRPVEIGLRRWTPAPVALADSWGGGVLVEFGR